jgi:hypothetical protein
VRNYSGEWLSLRVPFLAFYFADQDHDQIVGVAIDAGDFHAKGSANDDNPEHGGVSQSLSSTSDEQRPWTWNQARGNLDVLDSGYGQRVRNPTLESDARAGSSSDHGSGPNDFDGGNAVSSKNFVQHSSPHSLYPRIIDPLGHSSPQVSSDGVYTDYEAHIGRRTAPLSDRAAALSSPGAEAIDTALGTTPDTGQSAIFNANNGPNQAEITATEFGGIRLPHVKSIEC